MTGKHALSDKKSVDADHGRAARISAIPRQAAVLAGGRLAAAAMQALCFGLLARELGPSDFGPFAAAYGVAVFLQALCTLGLGPYLVSTRAIRGRREGPACDDTRLIDALKLSFSITIVLVAVSIALAALMVSLDTHVGLVLALLLCWAVVDNNAESWLAISLADGHVVQNSVATIVRRVIATAVLLVGIATGQSVDVAYCIGLILGSAAVVVGVWRRAPRDIRIGATLGWSWGIIRESLGYWSNTVLTQLRNLDSAVVGVSGASASVVGFYSAASRLTTPLRILPTSFAQALLPHAARTGSQGYRALLKPVAAISVFGLAVFGVVAALAPIAIPALLGSQYDGAVQPIQIVCVGLVFAGVASQLNSVLLGWRRAGLAAACVFISSAGCFAGLVYVASADQSASAAAAVLAGSFVLQLVMLIGCVFSAIRAERVRHHA